MIIVRIKGGLGNQLFQYAFGRTLMETKGVCVAFLLSTKSDYKWPLSLPHFRLGDFTVSSRLTRKFLISRRFPVPLSRTLFPKLACTRLVEWKDGTHREILDAVQPGESYFLDGYWQDSTLISLVETKLRHELLLSCPLGKEAEKILNMIEGSQSIGIHVRRKWKYNVLGERVPGEDNLKVLGLDYYLFEIEKAFKNKNDRGYKKTFFVFGDSMDWAREKFPIFKNCEYYFCDNWKARDYEDLILLSKCKNHIISNSTFCWWATWLSGNQPTPFDLGLLYPPFVARSTLSPHRYRDHYCSSIDGFKQ